MTDGPFKGKHLLGIDHRHHNEVTLQELIKFLEDRKILPENVILPDGFTAYT
jgi:hypothetical protein